MSALGGVVCNQPKKINSELLFSISRSMIMRGIVEKDAYINVLLTSAAAVCLV